MSDFKPGLKLDIKPGLKSDIKPDGLYRLYRVRTQGGVVARREGGRTQGGWLVPNLTFIWKLKGTDSEQLIMGGGICK